tara:strand:+ start:1920 stop:2543 length:624 start_codon:yes stop_codon:yes gene_type:complete
MPRKNDRSDLTCFLNSNPVTDMDNVYFSDEGWAYRHYKSYDKSNDVDGYWDEVIVAGGALLDNGQPDPSAEEFGSPGTKNFLFGDSYQSPFGGYSDLTSSGNSTIDGEMKVGVELHILTIPSFIGGITPVVYEYQWQQSDTGTGATWSGFESPWTSYDPSTVLIDPPAKLLNATVEGKYIRLQGRATDNNGVQVVAQGTVYGPVIPA